MRITSSTNISSVERLCDRIPAALSPATSQAMRDGADRSGEAYLSAMDARFDENESGGWQPLAGSTVRQRRREGFPGRNPILRRYGELRRALQRGRRGNVFRQLADGLDVGIGGDDLHSPYPDGLNKPTISIGAIAEIHQLGKGSNPIREILVEPDAETLQGIVGAQLDGVNQSINLL